MVKKLADDEIPQERYEKLKEFVEKLEEFGEGFDKAATKNNFVEDRSEDDIEVYIDNLQCLLSLYGFVEVM